jgi:hypothetical protein
MIPFPYIHDRSGSSRLYKSVLTLLFPTLHLVYPLISSVLPLFSVIRVPLESSPNIRCKVTSFRYPSILPVTRHPVTALPRFLIASPIIRVYTRLFVRTIRQKHRKYYHRFITRCPALTTRLSPPALVSSPPPSPNFERYFAIWSAIRTESLSRYGNLSLYHVLFFSQHRFRSRPSSL